MRVYSVKGVMIARDYFEYYFEEYRDDGTMVCTGAEDFSRQRAKGLKLYGIFIKTGKLDKGGHTRWMQYKLVKALSRKDVTKYASSVLEFQDFSVRLI